MDWLLTLFLALDDGTVRPVPSGMMVNEASCRLAGASMAQALAEARPGRPVGWRCDYQGAAS